MNGTNFAAGGYRFVLKAPKHNKSRTIMPHGKRFIEERFKEIQRFKGFKKFKDSKIQGFKGFRIYGFEVRFYG